MTLTTSPISSTNGGPGADDTGASVTDAQHPSGTSGTDSGGTTAAGQPATSDGDKRKYFKAISGDGDQMTERVIAARRQSGAAAFARGKHTVRIATTDDVMRLYKGPEHPVARAGEFEGEGKLFYYEDGTRETIVRGASSATVAAYFAPSKPEAVDAEELLALLEKGIKPEIAPD